MRQVCEGLIIYPRAPPQRAAGRARMARGPDGRYSGLRFGHLLQGAWVLHMLRNPMLDLRSMKEDVFTATMQDFYQQYRGRRASTRDFQRVVERHVGLPMSWFFDQWIDGTAIPTYILSWHAEPTQDGHYLLRVRVRPEDAPKQFTMPGPLKIDFGDGGHALVRVNVTGSGTEGTLNLPAEPKGLELNPLESVLADVKTEAWH